MSRPRPDDGRAPRTGRARRHLSLDVHRLLPVRPVFVFDEQRNRRTRRATAPHAADNACAIGLDRHATAAAVPALTAPQILRDLIKINDQPRGHAVENRDERRPVRFASGQKSQHRPRILYEVSATSGVAAHQNTTNFVDDFASAATLHFRGHAAIRSLPCHPLTRARSHQRQRRRARARARGRCTPPQLFRSHQGRTLIDVEPAGAGPDRRLGTLDAARGAARAQRAGHHLCRSARVRAAGRAARLRSGGAAPVRSRIPAPRPGPRSAPRAVDSRSAVELLGHVGTARRRSPTMAAVARRSIAGRVCGNPGPVRRRGDRAASSGAARRTSARAGANAGGSPSGDGRFSCTVRRRRSCTKKSAVLATQVDRTQIDHTALPDEAAARWALMLEDVTSGAGHARRALDLAEVLVAREQPFEATALIARTAGAAPELDARRRGDRTATRRALPHKCRGPAGGPLRNLAGREGVEHGGRLRRRVADLPGHRGRAEGVDPRRRLSAGSAASVGRGFCRARDRWPSRPVARGIGNRPRRPGRTVD